MERLLVFFDYFANERLYPTSQCTQNKKKSVITSYFERLTLQKLRNSYMVDEMALRNASKFVIFYKNSQRFLKHFANSSIDLLF